jgi:uncharacterized membrane-anchored protein YitT (DUF2179 family)
MVTNDDEHEQKIENLVNEKIDEIVKLLGAREGYFNGAFTDDPEGSEAHIHIIHEMDYLDEKEHERKIENLVIEKMDEIIKLLGAKDGYFAEIFSDYDDPEESE